MYTKFKNISGVIVKITTQQYAVGLYVFISINDKKGQFVSDMKERYFHIKLRKECLDNKGIILDGDIIQYKGKYNINKFEERITDIIPNETIIHSTGEQK